MSHKPVICLDFDGVIHQRPSLSYRRYIDGLNRKKTAAQFRRPWPLPECDIRGPLIPGAREAIEELRKHYLVFVHSVRCHSAHGRHAITRWLEAHGIIVDRITEHKPIAEYYIDDNSVRFSGDWSETLKIILGK